MWPPANEHLDQITFICELDPLSLEIYGSYRITAWDCMRLVRRGHFPVTWQRWWSYHWIRHTRKPRDARKKHDAIFYRTGVMGDGSLHCGNGNFYIAGIGILDLHHLHKVKRRPWIELETPTNLELVADLRPQVRTPRWPAGHWLQTKLPELSLFPFHAA